MQKKDLARTILGTSLTMAPEVLDEKPLVKDEKCAVKQENQTAGDVPDGLSTQVSRI